MEHSYSLAEPMHVSPAAGENNETTSLSALNLALWLSFTGLFGSALLVSVMGQINMAFTMPIAAVLFVSLVVVVFCFRKTTHHTLRVREESGAQSQASKAEPINNNVVKLRPVQTKNGHISYKRA